MHNNRGLALGGAIAALSVFTSANAAVTYDFDLEMVSGYRSISFSYTLPDYVVSTALLDPAQANSCVATLTTCTSIQFVTTSGASGNQIYVGLADLTPPFLETCCDGHPGPGTQLVSFALGSFAANGTYSASIQPAFGLTSTLTVFGFASPQGSAAPEPATWALMMVGFGGLGAVLRRRRRSMARLASV